MGRIFRLTLHGKLRPGIGAQNGTHFPVEPSVESSSRNRGSKWDVFSGWPANGKSVPELVLRMGRIFRLVLHGKIHPGIPAQNGIYFPVGPARGKCVPEFSFRLGQAFRLSIQAESPSRNPHSKRDTRSPRPACATPATYLDRLYIDFHRSAEYPNSASTCTFANLNSRR